MSKIASKVLVTGASGFVGRHICKRLSHGGVPLRKAVRSQADSAGIAVGDISCNTDWSRALGNVDVVVHTAARVHVMSESADDPLSLFRKVNVDGAISLARQAAQAGVRRLVYISSIKVNGESTEPGQVFTAEDIPEPGDPYSVSKYEAEQSLLEFASVSGMEVVIIRPPLIYGPGVKANFYRMMQWLMKGVPLPLASVDNMRSMVGLDNLVDLIVTCIKHPAAANQILLVSDGEDISTPELLKRMSIALNSPVRIFPCPIVVLKACSALVGQQEAARRLCDSLQLDISKTCDLLDWTPPISLREGLEITADDFLKSL
ncbi:MAG: SDR family oxidoreductase [Candidatus Sedimenticola sp. 6PFRAG1]